MTVMPVNKFQDVYNYKVSSDTWISINYECADVIDMWNRNIIDWNILQNSLHASKNTGK